MPTPNPTKYPYPVGAQGQLDIDTVISGVRYWCRLRWPEIGAYSPPSPGAVALALQWDTPVGVVNTYLDYIARFGGSTEDAFTNSHDGGGAAVVDYYEFSTPFPVSPSNPWETYTNNPGEIFERARRGVTYAGNDTLATSSIPMSKRVENYRSIIDGSAVPGWEHVDSRIVVVACSVLWLGAAKPDRKHVGFVDSAEYANPAMIGGVDSTGTYEEWCARLFH